jgi:hypothetical protein
MLRAGTATTLWRVVLPLLKPALVAALVYSFVRSMTTVSAVVFLVTAENELATTYIIGRVGNGDYGVALAYCTVLIVLMSLATALIQFLVGERKLGRRKTGAAPCGSDKDTEPPCITASNSGRSPSATATRARRWSSRVSTWSCPRARSPPSSAPSGCGKTTLLRMIAGLDSATGGTILIDGQDVTTLGPAERNVSMVFQSYALFPHMNVLDNVMLRPVGHRGGARRGPRARRAALEERGPGRLRRAPAQRALRRPAAARGGGARAGAGARGDAVRRAAEQPRRAPAPRDARGNPQPAATPQPDRGLCHPRPERGAGRERPDRGDEAPA